jgi:hypothetical protein
MVPDHPEKFDLSALYGVKVVSPSDAVLGKIIAVIHHGRGCDVLVERRRWLRVRVLRLDLDELEPLAAGKLRYQPRPLPLRRAAGGGPGDDAVA